MHAVKLVISVMFLPLFALAAEGESILRIFSADIYKNQQQNTYELVLRGQFPSDQHSINRPQRILIIPVEIEGDSFGIDLSYQYGVVGDTDSSTGGFKKLNGKTLADIFGVYRGKAGNIGVGIAGAGLHWATNSASGVEQQGGAAALLIGPSELGGINVGLTAKDYYFVVRPSSQTAQLKTVTVSPDWKFKEVVENIEINKVLNLKLSQ